MRRVLIMTWLVCLGANPWPLYLVFYAQKSQKREKEREGDRKMVDKRAQGCDYVGK